MKYYAVTDDPNELLHYGRLGMKWGEHIFVGPKSLAYKNAARKLKTSSNIRNKVEKFKSAVNKTRQQIAANHQRTQQNKYNNAVAKAQKRLSALEGMNNLDKLTSYERAMEHQIKNDAFAAKTEAKQMRFAEKMDHKYAKNERKMDKYTQLAREGRLAYGKLSEDQVNRITNRLAIEQNARRLGSTEKPKFRTRLKEAAQEGILQGVIQGTAAGMKEIAIDKVQNRLRNKRVLDKANRNDAERAKEANRIKNKKSRSEIREELRREAYEERVKEGDISILHPFTKRAANKLNKIEADREEQKFLTEESHNSRRNARQDLENEEREERKLFRQGELASLYGVGLNSGDSGGGNKGNNGNNGKKKGSNNQSSAEDAKRYYEQIMRERRKPQYHPSKEDVEYLNAFRQANKELREGEKETLKKIASPITKAANKIGDRIYETNDEKERRKANSRKSEPIAVYPTPDESYTPSPIVQTTSTSVSRQVENAQKNISTKRKRSNRK